MHFPVILAHGQLGLWDDIIFVGIAFIFLSVMLVAWIKSRNVKPDFTQQSATDEKETAEHFPLD
jgi:uncharacterized protein YktB (UPF0637 family)